MARRRPLDMERVLMIMFVDLLPGMCEGIDTPLCGGSNRHMDPNQRLSGECGNFFRCRFRSY